MAYRIEYIGGTTKRIELAHATTRKNRATVTAIVFIIICCLSLYRLGYERLCEVLVPGDPAVTETAAIQFVKEIQQGVPLKEAFSIFCKEIIHSATC